MTSNDIAPQMNIMNMVIPILMHFCACLPLKFLFCCSGASCIKPHVIQQNVTNFFGQCFTDILSQISKVIRQMSCYNSKYIRM